MDVFMIIFRIIHIFTGVFWVGVSLFMLFFVQPTVLATGEGGQKFMQHLSLRTRFSNAMMAVALLNVLSGLGMYWHIFEFKLDALGYGYGLVMSLGSLAAFIAFIAGYFLQNRSISRMKTLSISMAALEGPPSEVQLGEMKSLSATVSLGGRITTIFLGLSLLGMATAQYVIF